MLNRATGLALAVRAAKRAGDVRLDGVRLLPQSGGMVEVFFPKPKNHDEGELVRIDAVAGQFCPCQLLMELKGRLADGHEEGRGSSKQTGPRCAE